MRKSKTAEGGGWLPVLGQPEGHGVCHRHCHRLWRALDHRGDEPAKPLAAEHIAGDNKPE